MDIAFSPSSYKLQAHDHHTSRVTYLPVEIMKYFEDHHLSEVLYEFLLRCSIDDSLVRNPAQSLRRIAQKIRARKTFVMTDCKSEKLAYIYSEIYQAPIIHCKQPSSERSEHGMARSLRKFLKTHNMEGKNLVFFDFPKNVEGLRACVKYGFEPNIMVDVQKEEYDPYFVKFLWRRKVKRLRLEYEASNPNADQVLVQKLRELSLKTACPGKGWWHPRVLLIGRRGSHRDRQASLLAKEFGLVLIDTETIVLQLKDEEKCNARFIAATIYERLLKQDCLHNGWVMFGYPNTVEDLEILFRMIAPPNKIIFLHVRERVCAGRLEKMEHLSSKRLLIQAEMDFYNYNIQPMVDYCSANKSETMEIWHIDGNHSTETVKNVIWSKFM